ncbi:MAG: molybdopterin molybdotransferase [Eubacteriales bacterium]|nr:molybdopterin molybdotransferase [Eubacteriales bacterium]
MEPLQVVPVSEARQVFLREINTDHLATETVPLEKAFRRVLAEEVRAAEDIPAFPRATMDGYAVAAKDTFGASEAMPAYLTVAGEVLMGRPYQGEVKPGEAVRIATGGMLPAGTDAVVMLEFTEEMPDGTVAVNKPVAPGENVIQPGEDVAAGTEVLYPGRVIRGQEMGLLAALGRTRVKVYKRPRVGIISTGDELVRPEAVPGPGQIRDINSYSLLGQVYDAGGEGKIWGIVPDSYEQLLAVVRNALLQSDIVVISGGSSVGTRDITARVIQELGELGILVHGVSVRPGKPTILANVGGKPVVGLPGHPVSAMVIFDLFIRPAIARLMGAFVTASFRPCLTAKVKRNVASAIGRADYVAVTLEEENGTVYAEPLLGKSGLITTLVRADGLLFIPEEKEGLEEGEGAFVYLF